ncbi:MAG: coproporphyrinogen dehydrogenase HemZ [Lachnospiraceae bacterium]|nr:coproporphyrinogen dehydrogenase HemZ [Lachnospiraceae bacterium]
MIKVRLNRQSFQYDVHSLVRAFYPGEPVQVDCEWSGREECQKEPVEDRRDSSISGHNTGTEVLQGRILFLLEIVISADSQAVPGQSASERVGCSAAEECTEAAPPAVRIEISLLEGSKEKLHRSGVITAVGVLPEKAKGVFAGPVHSDVQLNSNEAAIRRETKNELKRLLYQILSDHSGKTLPWGNLTGIRPTKIPMALLNSGWSSSEIAGYMRETYYTGDDKIALAIEIANRERSLLKQLRFWEMGNRRTESTFSAQKEESRQDHAAGTGKAEELRPGRGAFDRGYSLYIGIPFCPSICLYCSFSSSPIALWKNQVDAYLDTLMHEIDCVAAMLPHNHPDTVYIGGGTPTTLEPEQLERLLSKLEGHFDLGGAHEFTVEAGRPDSITQEKLQVLKEHQVTRISINPQTMNQKTLDFIGRKHTTEQTAEAFALARRMGFNNINMDLIVGLPGEGATEVEHTMKVLSEMDPDSITVHSLAVKRAARLRLFKEEHQELSFENSSAIMDMTANYARAAGLHPYYLYRQKNMAGNFENVGYAREGREGLYNILIMEEIQSIIALGAGASTKLVLPQAGPSAAGGGADGESARKEAVPSAGGSEGSEALQSQTASAQSASEWGGTRIERIENVKDIKNYMERIDEMIERKQSALCGKEGGFYE